MEFMKKAIEEAKKAYLVGEVPIGAVIVKDGNIISSAANSCETNADCTCHAEMTAIKTACAYLSSKTLDDCEMYVTVEPCAMCTGAIINSRLKRLYIGAAEPKFGCCTSKAELLKEGLFNHNVEVYYGFSEDECKMLMQEFFKDKR